ncbi:MAG: ABC transporter permease [Bacteroides sp.]|nr:ABC transporter permease [Bacillota bacterium]MCM1393530.1 ABC transporter permease [[Eubacterium] siraeum]MCM1456193.1 ABC transporter permease [Bacteroides sp.]
MEFEKQSFSKKLKSMLKVDFKRTFTMPMVYILAGVCLALPILILVMTSMMTSVDPETGEAVKAFTSVWQIIGSASGAGMAMDLTGMCNINLIYFLIAIAVCVFVSEDFKSGYAKNLFAVRSKKGDYVISKTLAGFTVGVIMVLAFFIGAMLGGAIAGLSFDAGAASAGGIVACVFSKIGLVFIYVAVGLLASVIAKQKTWLSVLCAIAMGALLFTMLPMMAPLNASILNVIMCLGGGAIFGAGLGAVSGLVLKKSNLV